MNYTCTTQKRCETIVESQGAAKTTAKVRRAHPSIFRPCRLDIVGKKFLEGLRSFVERANAAGEKREHKG
jgi:hypothetical protein